MARLRELREQIDGLNHDLLRLLQARGELVLEISEYKRTHHLQAIDVDREERMLQDLERTATGPFDAEAIRDIFHAIFLASRHLQFLVHEQVVTTEEAGS